MTTMTQQRQAEARKMLGDDETKSVICLAEDIERIITGRLALALGLSGSAVGAIAARIRTELRDEIDAAVYHQRSTAFQGTPAI